MIKYQNVVKVLAKKHHKHYHKLVCLQTRHQPLLHSTTHHRLAWYCLLTTGPNSFTVFKQPLTNLSFLFQHQQQVIIALERAKQITMPELNAVIQAAAGSGLPGMPPGMPPPGGPGAGPGAGLPPGLAGIPGLPPTSMAGGKVNFILKSP